MIFLNYLAATQKRSSGETLYRCNKKNVWGSNPNIFTQNLRSRLTLPDVENNLTQFILHYPKKARQPQ